MKFSQREIDLARVFKTLGLEWEPAVGHYVYDETGRVQPTSPFQDRVYFVLNYEHFMQLVGGVEEFKRVMIWLPAWHDAREILEHLGVADVDVHCELVRQNSIENHTELQTLYELIHDQLKRQRHSRQVRV